MSIEKETDCQTNHGLSEAKPLSVTENWKDLAFILSAETFSVTPEKKNQNLLSLNKREQGRPRKCSVKSHHE